MSEDAIKYFDGDEFVAKVWLDKYALKDPKNPKKLVETSPDQMHERLATEFAKIEWEYYKKARKKFKTKLSRIGNKWKNLSEKTKRVIESNYTYEDIYQQIYRMFQDFEYIIPGGSIMSMAGSGQFGSISNCFILGCPNDSYSSINKLRTEQVNLMKMRKHHHCAAI